MASGLTSLSRVHVCAGLPWGGVLGVVMSLGAVIGMAEAFAGGFPVLGR